MREHEHRINNDLNTREEMRPAEIREAVGDLMKIAKGRVVEAENSAAWEKRASLRPGGGDEPGHKDYVNLLGDEVFAISLAGESFVAERRSVRDGEMVVEEKVVVDIRDISPVLQHYRKEGAREGRRSIHDVNTRNARGRVEKFLNGLPK